MDASGAVLRLVAPFLKVTGEVHGGDENRPQHFVTWRLWGTQLPAPPPRGIKVIKVDLRKTFNLIKATSYGGTAETLCGSPHLESAWGWKKYLRPSL